MPSGTGTIDLSLGTSATGAAIAVSGTGTVNLALFTSGFSPWEIIAPMLKDLFAPGSKGSGVPESGQGNENDIFFDNAGNGIYGPKLHDGTWPYYVPPRAPGD